MVSTYPVGLELLPKLQENPRVQQLASQLKLLWPVQNQLLIGVLKLFEFRPLDRLKKLELKSLV